LSVLREEVGLGDWVSQGIESSESVHLGGDVVGAGDDGGRFDAYGGGNLSGFLGGRDLGAFEFRNLSGEGVTLGDSLFEGDTESREGGFLGDEVGLDGREREASLVTRSALMAESSSTAPTVNFSTVARRSSRSAVNAWARRSAVESWSSIVIL
jgi:hypothetical protein